MSATHDLRADPRWRAGGPVPAPRPRRAGRDRRRPAPARRILAACLAPVPILASAALLLWTLTLSPFTAPFVERGTQEAELAIRTAMAREVDAAWVAARLDRALAAEDLDDARLALSLAERFGVPVRADQAEAVGAMEAELTGPWATATACGACAVDIASCPRLDLLAICGVPVEISPVGDVNALRRAGVAAWRGEEVDRLDAGLAVAGLAATGAVLLSGGTSVTVKAGTGLLRTARRLGTLTPAFRASLGRLADIGLRTDRILPYLLGRTALDEVADMGRVAALSAVAADIGRVADRTSLTDTALLLRHVDGPDDAARLARAAEAMGPETRAAFDVLGKARVFRALVRLSGLALLAAGMVYALALQVALWLAGRFGRLFWTALTEVVRGR
ncbi:hypothetical protein [Wenxinia saemankumensis]|uniref:Uncharacterized protein n=1 Tax=Wenxinia saemankumensis TaxID=1447782 RepID=A0A1M6E197_9RHOB|nr:hypothetical protein [Wenxinia saemankumensis]SHI79165.1 hypothetical protein SAMN05444417_1733 [Wenxinia saemankumensis]